MLTRGSAYPTAMSTYTVADAEESESSIIEGEVNIEGNQTIVEEVSLENFEVNIEANYTIVEDDFEVDIEDIIIRRSRWGICSRRRSSVFDADSAILLVSCPSPFSYP